MKIKYLASMALFAMAFSFGISARAEIASHVVISQIQISGGSGHTADDFVELYNPTDSEINLNGFRLVKRTSSTSADIALKSWTSEVIVPAHGFYLWANSGFTSLVTVPDATTTGTLAINNGIAIRQGGNDTGAIIDAVSWGDDANSFTETAAATTPPDGKVLLRKSGSTHALSQGNGWDTDDNSGDFIISDPTPRNSHSPAETLPPPPPVCPGGISVELNQASIETGNDATASAPTGWSGGNFLSSDPGVAPINGAIAHGNAVGTTLISGQNFTAPNGATGCGLEAVTLTVTAPPPVCPSGFLVSLNPASVQIGQSSTASAPAGWSGGNFISDNPITASVSGNTITGNTSGQALISGQAFTTPNGATNCSLLPATLTVTAPPSEQPPVINLIDQLKDKIKNNWIKLLNKF